MGAGHFTYSNDSYVDTASTYLLHLYDIISEGAESSEEEYFELVGFIIRKWLERFPTWNYPSWKDYVARDHVDAIILVNSGLAYVSILEWYGSWYVSLVVPSESDDYDYAPWNLAKNHYDTWDKFLVSVLKEWAEDYEAKVHVRASAWCSAAID